MLIKQPAVELSKIWGPIKLSNAALEYFGGILHLRIKDKDIRVHASN